MMIQTQVCARQTEGHCDALVPCNIQRTKFLHGIFIYQDFPADCCLYFVLLRLRRVAANQHYDQLQIYLTM